MKHHFKILALLLLLLTIAFYDIVYLGKTLKVTTANSQALPTGPYGQELNKPRFIPANGTDAPVSEEPIYEFIKNNLKRGILPLWNPHQAAGYSMVGMLEIGLFFPLTLIMYLLPNIIAWDILLLTRILLSGFLTYLFARHLNLKTAPALCAAIAFMLSGPMVLLQYWTANVDLLTPLLLIGIDLIVRKADRRSTLALALIVALTIFAGHPEHVFLVNAFGVAFFLFRIFSTPRKASLKKIFINYFFAYVLGAGLAAIVLFPFVASFNGEFWNNHPPGTGLLMEEQPDRALSILLPHFFQRENLTFDFTFAGWWGGYIGLLPVALGFIGLFSRQKSGMNYFFAGMALLIIAKQYGLPIINWLGHLPIFSLCRYAIHTPPLVAFSVAILCGMGARAILSGARAKHFSRGVLFCAVTLVIVVTHLFLLKNAAHYSLSIQASFFALGLCVIFLALLWFRDKKILPIRWLGPLLVAVIFLELFLYIHREHPRRFDSFAEVPYIEFLRSQEEPVRSYGIFWAFYPNTATGYEVDDLGYFLGLVPNRFVDFVNSALIKDHFRKDLRPPALRAIPIDPGKRFLLDLLNIKYIIAPSEERLRSLLINYEEMRQHLKPVYNREVMIFERPSALPRTYVVHRAIFEPDAKRSLEIVKGIGPTGRDGIVITHAPIPAIIEQMPSLPMRSSSTSEIVSRDPNEVVLNVQMEFPGFVVLGDAYHTDWKAYVNGNRSQIFQTNYLVRSVFVPAGSHEIRFIFQPVAFFIGIWVSLISWLLFIALAMAGLQKQRKPMPDRQGLSQS